MGPKYIPYSYMDPSGKRALIPLKGLGLGGLGA